MKHQDFCEGRLRGKPAATSSGIVHTETKSTTYSLPCTLNQPCMWCVVKWKKGATCTTWNTQEGPATLAILLGLVICCPLQVVQDLFQQDSEFLSRSDYRHSDFVSRSHTTMLKFFQRVGEGQKNIDSKDSVDSERASN